MVKTRKIEFLVKSSRYLPILAIIIALAIALAKVVTVHATGTVNPKDPCPI